MFILPHGTWKDNIRSVNFDWRKRSASRSSEWRDLQVTRANMSCVFSSRFTISQKVSPGRKICANSLSLYSYYTQSSPSKNKNINYIFIYLRVFRCLSSSSVSNTSLACKPLHHPRCTYLKHIIIYEALCFDVVQGQLNGAPNETRTPSCRFAFLKPIKAAELFSLNLCSSLLLDFQAWIWLVGFSV